MNMVNASKYFADGTLLGVREAEPECALVAMSKLHF